MAEERQRDHWSHTSLVLAVLANIHRDPKRAGRYTADDFNPFTARKPVTMKAGRQRFLECGCSPDLDSPYRSLDTSQGNHKILSHAVQFRPEVSPSRFLDTKIGCPNGVNDSVLNRCHFLNERGTNNFTECTEVRLAFGRDPLM